MSATHFQPTPTDDHVGPMTAYVYMLRCADGSLYVGSTRDLFARLQQHQLGLGATYTRDRRPVELVWHEEHENVAVAFSREKQVQNWSRVKRLALIDGDYEGLPSLAKKDFSRRHSQ
jgi:putative endonuclease